MTNRLATRLAVVFFAAGLFCLPVAGQEKELGQKYAELSDVQLWEEVMNCENREQIQALLDQIPISVMAKHAIVAMETPKNESNFGNMVAQILWTECSQDDEPGVFCKRIFKSFRWKDASGKFEVEAQIFDVRQSSVVLQKNDDSLVEVPSERLSTSSATRLKHYRTMRANIATRIPEDKEQLSKLIAERMVGVLERASRPKLLKTIEWNNLFPRVAPLRATLKYDSTGNGLIVSWSLGMGLSYLDVGKGKLIRMKLMDLPITAPKFTASKDHIQSRFQLRNEAGKNPSAELYDIEHDKSIPINGVIVHGTVSQNGATAAWVAKNNPAIDVMNTKTGQLNKIPDPSGPFWLSADGGRLVTVSQEKDSFKCQLWDANTATLIRESIPWSGSWQGLRSFLSKNCSLVLIPGENAMDGSSRKPCLLNLITGESQDFGGEFLSTLEHATSGDLEFTNSGKHILLVTDDGICSWDIAGEKSSSKWKRKKNTPIVEVKCSPDESKLVVLTLEGDVLTLAGDGPSATLGIGDGLEIWDLISGKQMGEIPTEEGELIVGFEINPDSNQLATLCFTPIEHDQGAKQWNYAIKIWRLPK